MNRFCLTTLIVLSAVIVLVPGAALADSHADTIALFRSSPAVAPFFESAYGYAVFPLVGKGGFIFGATYGKGKVYRGGTATGTAELSKMTIGFQFGGQAFSEIIFFEDQRAYDEFTRGGFNFDVNASAVAITAAAQASAGSMGSTAGASIGPATGKQAGTSYYKGMATFTHAKGGLMIEASIGGQTFEFEPYQ
jgi:lipid-binding SYLF domain-containing protein